MSYHLTIFDNVLDRQTHKTRKFARWSSFVTFLKKCSEIEGYKPPKGDLRNPKASKLISPAHYKPNTTRKNDSVIKWSRWCALDIDAGESIDKTLEPLAPYNSVCYSTASSKIDSPKFRIILNLTHEVEASKIKHFWFALNSEFNETVDPQTKDLSRMFYVPALYPDSFHFFIHNRGTKILDPTELMSKYRYSDRAQLKIIDKIPESFRERLKKHAIQNRLENRDLTWTGYRDCPFVNKDMVIEYGRLTRDWYHFMYKIMVSIASRALKMGYPISVNEIIALVKDIDQNTGNWYKNRRFDIEANRALTFAIENTVL